MECITWFAPTLPGKLDEWKAGDAEMSGPRYEHHTSIRLRLTATIVAGTRV